jgi:hypothetical protein
VISYSSSSLFTELPFVDEKVLYIVAQSDRRPCVGVLMPDVDFFRSACRTQIFLLSGVYSGIRVRLVRQGDLETASADAFEGTEAHFGPTQMKRHFVQLYTKEI